MLSTYYSKDYLDFPTFSCLIFLQFRFISSYFSIFFFYYIVLLDSLLLFGDFFGKIAGFSYLFLPNFLQFNLISSDFSTFLFYYTVLLNSLLLFGDLLES